jgi:3-hydroxyanthranilate 3,4-dioxygenase
MAASSFTTPFTAVNINEYVDDILPSLKPPVANRVWFAGPQFFVMIVGGPNKRDDFHFQPGQELFWQLRGPMQLDVMEQEEGNETLQRKKIPIADGEMFLLPKLTHHSPQRFPETVGLVCERIRSPDDIDFLKWFVPNTGDILYEENFNCSDIGSQLKIVIERFFASPQSEILKTTPKNEIDASARFIPFHLDSRIEQIREQSKLEPSEWSGAPRCDLIVDGEFIVRLFSGAGTIEHPIWQGDSFLVQKNGLSKILALNGSGSTESYSLESGQATWFPRSPAGSTATISLTSPDACLMMITCGCCVVE